MNYIRPRQVQIGFTLVEMAMVLMIVALLLGGLLPTISSQVEQRQTNETRKQLDEIQQALIGFAVVNGRLPCPASSTSNGVEKFASGDSTTGICSNFYDGYVPAATLGLSGTDSSGLVKDPWGFPIRYAVTKYQYNSNYVFTAFSSTTGMSTAGITNLSSPNLYVCNSATASGFSGASCGTNNALTSNGVPAVIYSTGKNAGSGGTTTNYIDEAANPNPNYDDNNQTFVSHTPTPSGATNGEFDDIVIWISPNVLINRMVAAGKLP